MKKILIFSCLLIAMATTLFAQKPVELPLWQNVPPNSNKLSGPEKDLGNGRIGNVSKPTITVYPADKPNGTAIVMCPGGGYSYVATKHEGHDMAAWFNEQGIAFAVLKYRMPNGNPEVPLSDAKQAMRIMRKHAAEWGVNPARVGIMGASAGGHLAASLANLSSKDTRPDFQILLYPVISMQKGLTHSGSRKNLLGEKPSAKLEQKFSLDKQVSASSPQAFIALSADDDAVSPENGTGYYRALKAKKVPAVLHTYPTGKHGWGFRDTFKYKAQWTSELKKWLAEEVRFSS